MLFTGYTTVGDFLKSNTKLFLKTVLISAVCLILFIGAGYFYLRGSFVTAQNENNSVPYYKQIPQNSGLLFEISGDKTYFYLDFENQNILVAFSGESFEYPVDFKAKADLDFVADFVDSIGGIELVLENKIEAVHLLFFLQYMLFYNHYHPNSLVLLTQNLHNSNIHFLDNFDMPF